VKNAKPSDASEIGYLEKWFVGKHKSMEEYHREYSRKAIITPKFLRMLWLKEEKLDEIREALKFQRLEKFVKLSGNVYPYLVKVFLTNMWYDEDTIYSLVKGVDICINDEFWLAIVGLRNAGIPIGRSNVVGLEEFNKVQFFKSCLRNPNTESRSHSVGGLPVTPRILAFIVIWLSTLKGFNHAILTKEDLMLMYCLLGIIQVNWVSVIKEDIIKIRRKIEYIIPYVVLVSHFIEYIKLNGVMCF